MTQKKLLNLYTVGAQRPHRYSSISPRPRMMSLTFVDLGLENFLQDNLNLFVWGWLRVSKWGTPGSFASCSFHVPLVPDYFTFHHDISLHKTEQVNGWIQKDNLVALNLGKFGKEIWTGTLGPMFQAEGKWFFACSLSIHLHSVLVTGREDAWLQSTISVSSYL